MTWMASKKLFYILLFLNFLGYSLIAVFYQKNKWILHAQTAVVADFPGLSSEQISAYIHYVEKLRQASPNPLWNELLAKLYKKHDLQKYQSFCEKHNSVTNCETGVKL